VSYETATALKARVADSPSPFLGLDLDSTTRRDFTLRFWTCSGTVSDQHFDKTSYLKTYFSHVFFIIYYIITKSQK